MIGAPPRHGCSNVKLPVVTYYVCLIWIVIVTQICVASRCVINIGCHTFLHDCLIALLLGGSFPQNTITVEIPLVPRKLKSVLPFALASEYERGTAISSLISQKMSLDDATKRLQSTKQSLDDAYSPPGEQDFIPLYHFHSTTTFASSQLPRDRGDEPADARGGQQAVHRLRGAHADEPAGVQDQGVPVSSQVQRLRLAQDGNQEGSPGDSPE